MSTTRKMLLTLLLVGVVGATAGLGTFSAFSSTTDNTGNNFTAGSVTLSDNDAGSALYNVTNAKPGDSNVSCILLTYSGSLDSDVKLYTTSSVNAFASNVDLTIEKGTGSGAFPACTGFSAQSTIYSGTLANFASTKNSYANGIAAYPGAATKWSTGDTLVYRFTVTLNSAVANSAQGGTTGSHSFTWEARNQ
jgi:predicted ribosomally synthesized peptide with SipW-like signal peptide